MIKVIESLFFLLRILMDLRSSLLEVTLFRSFLIFQKNNLEPTSIIRNFSLSLWNSVF